MSDKICAMMNSRRSLQLALRWEVIQCRWPHYIWFKISVSVKSFLHAMRTFTIWCFFLFGSCNLPPLSFHYCFGRSGDLSYNNRIDFSDLLWIGYRLVENFVRQTHFTTEFGLNTSSGLFSGWSNIVIIKHRWSNFCNHKSRHKTL